jgi:ABC-type branched-subunit amino acid transport system substrate-binding protein
VLNRSRRAIGLACVAGALSLAVVACGGDNGGAEAGSGGGGSKEDLKFGALVPLTGALAEPGSWTETSLKYAVKEINAAGGIDGRQVKLTIADDAADPTQDVNLATKFLNQDRVDLLMTGLTSDGTLAVSPLVSRMNVAGLGVAGSPSLTPDKVPNVFMTLLNAGDQSRRMVQYAQDQGFKSAAILHDNGEQGRNADKVMNEELKAAGIQITGDASYALGDTDLTPQLVSLQKGDPDALLLYTSSGDDAGHALAGMKQIGWSTPIVGSYGVHYADVIIGIAGKKSLENAVATTYAPFGACPGSDISPETKKFVDGLQAFDPKVFKTIQLDLAASIRDGVWVMKHAIEGAKSTDGDKVRAWLESNSSSLGDGLVNPKVSVSGDSHFLFGPDDMVLVRPGKEVGNGVYERVDC